MRVTLAVVVWILCATPIAAAVSLPVEVLGPDGTVESVTVVVPAGKAHGVTALWLQVHNVSYPNRVTTRSEASVQVNGGAWTALTNASVQQSATQTWYGGIGGGFHTLKVTLPLAAGAVVDGANTVTFRFDGTDGVCSGYRVLKLNLLAGATPVIPESAFAYDDPTSWTAPPGGDRARGQALWNGAKPLVFSPIESTRMAVSCRDCHAQDGRDLKYFNYSNRSIRVRTKFHGLSDQDADDVAAYIRGLPVHSAPKGRPWNPPYQPGPGLDAQPLADWSAGAGIDAVLERDQDLVPYLFPGGVIDKEAIRPEQNFSIRETPIEIQFPDWNHWLPHTHPRDGWSDFAGSDLAAQYGATRSLLEQGQRPAPDGLGVTEAFDVFGLRYSEFTGRHNAADAPWTPAYSRKLYDVGLWTGVKTWELMQEFDVEHYGTTIFGRDLGDERGWFQGYLFDFSPNLLHIPLDERGVQGSTFVTDYLSHMWYQVQLTLYSHRFDNGQRPMDWPYTWGFFRLRNDDGTIREVPNGLRLMMSMVKSSQMTTNGWGPEDSALGWSPDRVDDLSRLVHHDLEPLWSDTPPDVRRRVCEAMIGAWLDESQRFPPQTYRSNLHDWQRGQDGIADPTAVPTGAMDGSFGDRLAMMVPQFRRLGVDETLLGRVLDWSRILYPRGAWDTLRDTRMVRAPYVGCSSPTDGATYAGPADIDISGWIEGFWPVPPTKLAIYLDGGVRLGEVAIPNGRFTWRGVQPGTYRLALRAELADGAFETVGSSTFVVTGTRGANRPPNGVRLATPQDGAVYASDASLTLMGMAFDDDDDVIAKAEFYDGATKLGEVTEQSWNGHYDWVWDHLAPGQHVLTMRAFDRSGAASTSAPVTITVAAPAAPTIYAAPRDVTARAGQSAGFTVVPAGSPPFTYQWQVAPGASASFADVPGATAAMCATPLATAADSGDRYRVRVGNARGAIVSSAAVLTVVGGASPNTPPVATITAPAPGATFGGGDSIAYAGSGSDAQDGVLAASAFTWQVDLHDGASTTAVVPATSGARSGSFAVPTALAASASAFYRVTLTLRDSAGATTQVARDVQPRTSTLRLATDPSGLALTFDGAAATSVVAIHGVQHQLGAATTQSAQGHGWTFVRWSDGGAAQHALVTPSADATYTATYRSADGGVVGSGTGLSATYWDNMDFTGATVSRTDPQVLFDWGSGSPAPAIGADTFSARWTGEVQAQFSETYTFTVRADDGLRLRVNGQVLIDRWVDQSPTAWSGSIALTAGQRVPIVLEYYENAGGAVCQMRWSSASTSEQPVPTTQLYPAVSTPYGGAPRALPGVVQAEDFDDGGEGVGYHDADAADLGGGYRSTGVDLRACVDTGGGWQVGWTRPGEWLAYTVAVASAGPYDIAARVASGASGGTIHVSFDGVDATGPMAVVGTGGWDAWRLVVKPGVRLSAGVHLMRVAFDAGALDLNHIAVLPASTEMVSGLWCKLLAQHSGKCLDVAGASAADGANVQQWDDNGTAAQQWRLDVLADGSYTLTARCSGKLLDDAGASIANGGNVVQSTARGADDQRWWIEDTGGGGYRLTAVRSGKSLSVADSATTAGANVLQWVDVGKPAQRWRLVSIAPNGMAEREPRREAALAAASAPWAPGMPGALGEAYALADVARRSDRRWPAIVRSAPPASR